MSGFSHIVGVRPVIEAVNAVLHFVPSSIPQSIQTIYLSKTAPMKTHQMIVPAARNAKIPVKIIPPDRLASLARRIGLSPYQVNHQGVIAEVAPFQFSAREVVLESAMPRTVVVLDQIQDPHNFGAIIRSADASGVSAVVIQERHAASITHTVYKASAGAIAYVPIIREVNLSRVVAWLKGEGFHIVGVTQSGDQTYGVVPADCDLAIIFGNEGRGIRPGLLKRCDTLAKIPMVGHVESINVSVAAGVFLFDVHRRRAI